MMGHQYLLFGRSLLKQSNQFGNSHDITPYVISTPKMSPMA